jgi:glutamyl-tRNA reductase
VEYESFLGFLSEADIVIASSGAPHYILNEDQVRQVRAKRKGRPLFLIDIAVPRNIEPSVNTLENVFLYDIDDLGKVVEQNRRGREKEAAAAEAIISDEVDKLIARLKAREAAPLIVGLQEQFESIRTAELQRMRGKLGALTPQQEEAIDALTKAILAKIAHGPISEIRKQCSTDEGWPAIETIKRIFRLGGSES